MNSERTHYLTIRFSNGHERSFAYHPADEDSVTLAGKIEKLLDSGRLVLELDDSVVVVPFANVESIVVTPKPAKLPASAIKILQEFTDD